MSASPCQHHAEHLRSAFKTFGGFSSGIGIRYQPSFIVNPTHQTLATGLTVGERMVPQVFIRAADSHPLEIHDLLPADTRFKILVFAGDITVHDSLARLSKVGEHLNRPTSFLRRFGRGAKAGEWEVFDVMCFTSAKSKDLNYLGVYSCDRLCIGSKADRSHRLPGVLPSSMVEVRAHPLSLVGYRS